MLIADSGNNRIVLVPKLTGFIYGVSVFLRTPTALAVDTAGNVYVGDSANHRVLFMPRTTGTYFGVSMVANWMYVIAGTGVLGNGASGSLATSCALNEPTGICVDSAGNVFIADNGNSRILFIPKTSGTYFGSVNV